MMAVSKQNHGSVCVEEKMYHIFIKPTFSSIFSFQFLPQFLRVCAQKDTAVHKI